MKRIKTSQGLAIVVLAKHPAVVTAIHQSAVIYLRMSDAKLIRLSIIFLLNIHVMIQKLSLYQLTSALYQNTFRRNIRLANPFKKKTLLRKYALERMDGGKKKRCDSLNG